MTVENDGADAARRADEARRRQADEARRAQETQQAQQVQQAQQPQPAQPDPAQVPAAEEPARAPVNPETQTAARASAAGEEDRRRAEMLRPPTAPTTEAPRTGIARNTDVERPTTAPTSTAATPTATSAAPPATAQAGDNPDGGGGSNTPAPPAATTQQPTTQQPATQPAATQPTTTEPTAAQPAANAPAAATDPAATPPTTTPATAEPTPAVTTGVGDGDPTTAEPAPTPPLSAAERTALRERVQREPGAAMAQLREAVDGGRINAAGAAEVLRGNERQLAEHLARPGATPAERTTFARDLALSAHAAGPETARSLGREIASTAMREPRQQSAVIGAVARAAGEPRGALLAVTTAAAMPPMTAGKSQLESAAASTIERASSNLARATREATPAVVNEQRFVATHGAGLGPEATQRAVDSMREANADRYVALAAAAGPADQLRSAVAEAQRSPNDLLSSRAREATAQNGRLDDMRAVFADSRQVPGAPNKAPQHANRAAAKALGSAPGAGPAGGVAALTALYNAGSGDEIAKALGDFGRDTLKTAGAVTGPASQAAPVIRAAGSALGRATAALDLLAAGRSASQGDYTKAGLQVGAGLATAASTTARGAAVTVATRLGTFGVANAAGVAFSLAQAGYEVARSAREEQAYRGEEQRALAAAGVDPSAATRAQQIDPYANRALDQIARDTGRTPQQVYAAVIARGDNTGAAVSWLGRHGFDSTGAQTVRHDDRNVPGGALLADLYARLRAGN